MQDQMTHVSKRREERGERGVEGRGISLLTSWLAGVEGVRGLGGEASLP